LIRNDLFSRQSCAALGKCGNFGVVKTEGRHITKLGTNTHWIYGWIKWDGWKWIGSLAGGDHDILLGHGHFVGYLLLGLSEGFISLVSSALL